MTTLWIKVAEALPDDIDIKLVMCNEYLKLGFYCSECNNWFELETEKELTGVTYWQDIQDLPDE